MSRSSWTAAEDAEISRLVQEDGEEATHAWSNIARLVSDMHVGPVRTGKQCRTRWMNHLSPTISREPWTEEEEEALYRAQEEFGNRWARIAEVLPGRSDNCIKNHWYSTMRRNVRKIHRELAHGGTFSSGEVLNDEATGDFHDTGDSGEAATSGPGAIPTASAAGGSLMRGIDDIFTRVGGAGGDRAGQRGKAAVYSLIRKTVHDVTEGGSERSSAAPAAVSRDGHYSPPRYGTRAVKFRGAVGSGSGADSDAAADAVADGDGHEAAVSADAESASSAPAELTGIIAAQHSVASAMTPAVPLTFDELTRMLPKSVVGVISKKSRATGAAMPTGSKRRRPIDGGDGSDTDAAAAVSLIAQRHQAMEDDAGENNNTAVDVNESSTKKLRLVTDPAAVAVAGTTSLPPPYAFNVGSAAGSRPPPTLMSPSSGSSFKPSSAGSHTGVPSAAAPAPSAATDGEIAQSRPVPASAPAGNSFQQPPPPSSWANVLHAMGSGMFTGTPFLLPSVRGPYLGAPGIGTGPYLGSAYTPMSMPGAMPAPPFSFPYAGGGGAVFFNAANAGAALYPFPYPPGVPSSTTAAAQQLHHHMLASQGIQPQNGGQFPGMFFAALSSARLSMANAMQFQHMQQQGAFPFPPSMPLRLPPEIAGEVSLGRSGGAAAAGEMLVAANDSKARKRAADKRRRARKKAEADDDDDEASAAATGSREALLSRRTGRVAFDESSLTVDPAAATHRQSSGTVSALPTPSVGATPSQSGAANSLLALAGQETYFAFTSDAGKVDARASSEAGKADAAGSRGRKRGLAPLRIPSGSQAGGSAVADSAGIPLQNPAIRVIPTLRPSSSIEEVADSTAPSPGNGAAAATAALASARVGLHGLVMHHHTAGYRGRLDPRSNYAPVDRDQQQPLSPHLRSGQWRSPTPLPSTTAAGSTAFLCEFSSGLQQEHQREVALPLVGSISSDSCGVGSRADSGSALRLSAAQEHALPSGAAALSSSRASAVQSLSAARTRGGAGSSSSSDYMHLFGSGAMQPPLSMATHLKRFNFDTHDDGELEGRSRAMPPPGTQHAPATTCHSSLVGGLAASAPLIFPIGRPGASPQSASAQPREVEVEARIGGGGGSRSGFYGDGHAAASPYVRPLLAASSSSPLEASALAASMHRQLRGAGAAADGGGLAIP